ncbi:hypothetical protein [Cohnella rhizosphaerae]|uniref:Polyprenyl synthetase family protein n=1 Tax=Cohnella rhizosphaerae TaxID=1457232 RepID=A0A9X4KVZ0_9BACL|nr:hypothetical protein [Cohnella rhizosphaerae]MDG0811463.1 hypothetical protein [Cohnella rhizosphaerae]
MKTVQAEPDVDREIADVFAEAAAGANAYPEPMGDLLRGLVLRADPTGRDRKSNYIAFMLPAWIGERTGADPAMCRDLAVGNVYAMLHFFLLDDAMDGGGAGLEGRRSLAAGQLLHALFMERYGRHFPPDSPLVVLLPDVSGRMGDGRLRGRDCGGRIRATPARWRANRPR